jgi:hypothetical protein
VADPLNCVHRALCVLMGLVVCPGGDASYLSKFSVSPYFPLPD